jgi:beta-ureidopropionase / N-carbamoyl-L-amino-acid hydrolase
MAEAGLDATIDGVGNVIGRSRNPGSALLIGSHSDTQPTGGWLDGAMGVIYALEIARSLGEDGETRALAVDVASWIDEEGAYFSFLGSKSFCAEPMPDAWAQVTGRDGRSLAEAIAAAEFAGRAPARLDPARHIGYLEAHIEQGGRLEAAGKRIGVVTNIVGIRNFIIAFKGAQNHAGTTPMPLRRDAGAALIDLAYAIRARFAELAGADTVWTIGHIELHPGAPSIIPGRAEMVLQFRDPAESRLDLLEATLHSLVAAANAAGHIEIAFAAAKDGVAATAMDGELQRHLGIAAEAHAPGGWMLMPSGAGHDAQILARHVPSAMLFVPSIGGISHDFAEDTAEDDVVLGCQVLATACVSILRELARTAPAGRRV